MIVNRQNLVRLDLAATRRFVRKLRAALRLDGRSFDVSFVNVHEIQRLNATYRGKRRPTDVLSFPWTSEGAGTAASTLPIPLSKGAFLGDIVISPEIARRNARQAGHSVRKETFWLITHGALHLLGYDHEKDHGEMTRFELLLRERMGIEGGK